MDEVQELSERAKIAVQDVWLIIINMPPMNDDTCDGERFPITFYFFLEFHLSFAAASCLWEVVLSIFISF